MKKTAIVCLCALLFCTLSACAGGEGPAQTSAPSAPSSQAEPPKTLSQQEMEGLFQKVLDSGDIRSQEAEQVARELSELKMAGGDALPEDYEARYKTWREEQAAAWKAEEVERLKEEYRLALLKDKDLIAAWDEKRECYADYVDFDGDGLPELLVISRDKNTSSFSIKVSDGKEGQMSEPFVDDFVMHGVRLYQDNVSPKIYLECYTYAGGTEAWNHRYRFFELVDGEWRLAARFDQGVDNGSHDLIKETLEELGTDVERFEPYWLSLDGNITEAEYTEKLARYTECQELLSIQEDEPFPEGGILSDVFSVSLTMNGQPVELGIAPFMEDGFMMAPVRPILEAMGVTVHAMSTEAYDKTWDAAERSMSIRKPPMVVLSTKKRTCDIRATDMMDDNEAASYHGDYGVEYGDSNRDGADAPAPRVVNGQLVGPVSEIVKFFGGSAEWELDAGGRMLSLTGSIPETDRISEREIETVASFSINDAKAIMKAQGYQFFRFDWNGGDSFKNGRKFWKFVVLPIGVEYEIYPDPEDPSGEAWYGPTNATCVTVWNDGTVNWGEAYYQTAA